MRNIWLSRRLRKRVRAHLTSFIASCFGIPECRIKQARLNESYIDKCTDYAMRLIDKYGYTGGIQEMESIIRYSASIDRNRFFRQ